MRNRAGEGETQRRRKALLLRRSQKLRKREALFDRGRESGIEDKLSTSGPYINVSARKAIEVLRDVGAFPANRFGLHDMHGGVFEWTQSSFDWRSWGVRNWLPQGAASDVDMQGAALQLRVLFNDDDYLRWIYSKHTEPNNLKVLKGGCWALPRKYCRSDSVFVLDRRVRLATTGFRLVFEPK